MAWVTENPTANRILCSFKPKKESAKQQYEKENSFYSLRLFLYYFLMVAAQFSRVGVDVLIWAKRENPFNTHTVHATFTNYQNYNNLYLNSKMFYLGVIKCELPLQSH